MRYRPALVWCTAPRESSTNETLVVITLGEEAAILPRGKFYGITASVELGGATLSEVYHGVPRALPLHGHEAAYFCMLLEGEYRERTGATEVDYRPFTIAFHAVGLLHVDEIGDSGARFFIVELDERWSSLAQTFMPSSVPLAEVRGGWAVWTALRLYLDMRGGGLSELSVESALYELIGGLRTMYPVDDAERESEALTEIVRAIDAGLADPLSLTELARHVDVHPVHLARIFRRKFNRSIGEHIQGRRVQTASAALLEEKRSLAQIASDCGFFDQSHFTRVFKSVTGTTPGAYRKRMSRQR